MIHVIATIEIKPGQRVAFLAQFHRIVPLVKAEAGCLEYGPAIDLASGIPAQGVFAENVVVVIEKWASLEALHAHLQAPHMAEYRMAVKELVAGVNLQVLEPA